MKSDSQQSRSDVTNQLSTKGVTPHSPNNQNRALSSSQERGSDPVSENTTAKIVPVNNSLVATNTSTLAPSKTAELKSNDWSLAVDTLLEQPPATLPLRLIIGGIVFSIAFAAWAWFGQIEQVGKARGKLVPEGEAYKIQPVELGKVIGVAVKEGQEVKAGQVLVELDTELANKEVERLAQMLKAYRKELSQKQDLLEKVNLETKTNAAIATAATLAHREAIALEEQKAQTFRRLLAQQNIETEAYRQRQTQLNPISQIAQERLNQLQAQIRSHQERIKRIKPLVEQGAVSQEYLFQAEQELRQAQQQITQSQLQDITNASEQIFQADRALGDIEARTTQQQGELASAVQEIERLQVELVQKQAEEQRIQLEAQQKIKQLELEIAEVKGKMAETKTLLASAQTKVKQNYLKAPVNGIVSSLDIKQPGKVVQAGETVVEIAPQGVPLILSAVLPNEEAGFVKEGMPVQVKLDAYPYQDYGVIPGTVTSVSPDAESNEQLGEVYRVEIILARDYVTDGQRSINFKTGQTATADIVIRRRRIAEVLLDPIQKIQKDGIKL
ncbi:HlyD family efflux transporter periplasmic adaptor subunit [Pleurocapsales cyanobacterium LEGE 06147]|nr:HlyD family efflux transporter periplasmic adaptor subunit [Pleurocapsales cyanobacterium LEGE 06147]